MKTINKKPRCPLCHADFDRRLDSVRQLDIKKMLDEAIAKYKTALDDKARAKALAWCQKIEASLKEGAAEVFLCHFCKIGIGVNDPFVGRWEEAYAKGEKIFCPACDHEVRYFCTSTGFMLAQCPVKKCRSRMQLSQPDRKNDEATAIAGVDRAVASPDAPAIGQQGASGMGEAEGLPSETEIKVPLPEVGGHA